MHDVTQQMGPSYLAEGLEGLPCTLFVGHDQLCKSSLPREVRIILANSFTYISFQWKRELQYGMLPNLRAQFSAGWGLRQEHSGLNRPQGGHG